MKRSNEIIHKFFSNSHNREMIFQYLVPFPKYSDILAIIYAISRDNLEFRRLPDNITPIYISYIANYFNARNILFNLKSYIPIYSQDVLSHISNQSHTTRSNRMKFSYKTSFGSISDSNESNRICEDILKGRIPYMGNNQMCVSSLIHAIGNYMNKNLTIDYRYPINVIFGYLMNDRDIMIGMTTYLKNFKHTILTKKSTSGGRISNEVYSMKLNKFHVIEYPISLILKFPWMRDRIAETSVMCEIAELNINDKNIFKDTYKEKMKLQYIPYDIDYIRVNQYLKM